MCCTGDCLSLRPLLNCTYQAQHQEDEPKECADGGGEEGGVGDAGAADVEVVARAHAHAVRVRDPLWGCRSRRGENTCIVLRILMCWVVGSIFLKRSEREPTRVCVRTHAFILIHVAACVAGACLCCKTLSTVKRKAGTDWVRGRGAVNE
jgi:hypothetical protein